MLRQLHEVLGRVGVAAPLRRVLRRLHPVWRREQRALVHDHNAFLGGQALRIQAELGTVSTNRRAVVVGYANPKVAGFQAPLLFALRVAGFRVTVLLPSSQGAAADFYRALGCNAVLATEDLTRPAAAHVVHGLKTAARDQATLLALSYRGIPIGRFVASTLMRQRRLGNADPRVPEVAGQLAGRIAASVNAADVALAAIAQIQPDLVCFFDRGYTPDAELFEAALASGAQAITLNAAHRSGLILCKRYHQGNKDRHPGSLSVATWDMLRSMPWTERHWETLRTEVETSYRAGTWYDEVGTQFGKKRHDSAPLLSSLGLDPARKTAVVFPHLFWDATFFWGDDLFADYRDWFCHVLRAAARNKRLNWIIKLHPASVIKDQRDGYRGEPSEVAAIRETLGSTPAHIAVLPPDSPVSTLSLYSLMDYCLTVRGTVGIEAAIFGIPVLTAGTGRYDGYGFTVDSANAEEYLARLEKLDTLMPPTAAQIEMARRYAYGLFMMRPLELETLRFHYRQDEGATLDLALNLPRDHCLSSMPDIVRLATWLAGQDDDLIGASPPMEIPA